MIIALTIIAWSAVAAASIPSFIGIALMVRGYLDARAMRRAERARKRLERAGVIVLASRLERNRTGQPAQVDEEAVRSMAARERSRSDLARRADPGPLRKNRRIYNR